MKMHVLKFGGTSIGDADRIRDVARIVAARAGTERLVVVVSAMAGVTTSLIRAATLASADEGDEAAGILRSLAELQHGTALAVADAAGLDALVEALESRTRDVDSLVRGIALVRDCSARVLDAVVAHGELCSSAIVASALRAAGVDSRPVDARSIVVTDAAFGNARVDFEQTDRRIRDTLGDAAGTPVVTGFIAATADGTTTTLGRGGSDFTATIVGAALDADAIEIWTDVDGVMSADPRLVPQAFPLPRLSYTELMELSHFGAKVVHPPAVNPARQRGIPLVIRNTMRPDSPGTIVLPDDAAAADPDGAPGPPRPVRGISSIHGVTLCRLDGVGMVGVPGIASRLFGALARERINVILISQASSEHSICFALDPVPADRATRVVDDEFAVERAADVVDPLVTEPGFAIIAAVGEAMRDTPGISGRLFGVLGRNGINVRAIAQGSSELNISLLVRIEDEERALRLIHDAFFLPRAKTVQVFIAGTGRVGAALLDQLAERAASVAERVGVRLLVSGVARSRTAALAAEGLDLSAWRTTVPAATAPASAMLDMALRSPNAHRIFVDCTANADVAASYEALLRAGIGIVTANKIALSGEMALYQRLRDAARRGNGLYAETTVGAGLPVLRPIADLVATGDTVHRIEGVLSGTLGYLFANVMRGGTFSDVVREAHRLGLTEPDPREDLGGRDVARKLLILAREAGFELEPDQVRVEPVLSGPAWTDGTAVEFLARLPDADARFAALREKAAANGRVLCYLASLDADGAEVGLREIERDHPCAQLTPGDNLVMVTSARYSDKPLIIRGPGAGPAVTAAGVFADMIRAGAESV
jgi:aspartokinase/homoserine dehydrogenase 1